MQRRSQRSLEVTVAFSLNNCSSLEMTRKPEGIQLKRSNLLEATSLQDREFHCGQDNQV